MRLRNIPRAHSVLESSKEVISDETLHKGRWREAFGNDRPVHIEIGMGKGQFLLTLASRNPGVNYIGIERYSSVLLRAVERLEQRKTEMKIEGKTFPNVRFICMDAADIAQTFAKGEVERIYLNFSDPWPKARHARRRLTSREYFERYDQILAVAGQVEFKTDNRVLFEFSLEELVQSKVWKVQEYTFDLHHNEEMNVGNVKTEYEEKFSSMGNTICKLTAVRK